MPTYDEWTPIKGFKQAEYRARQRMWVRTPNYGALPKDQKPVNPYTDTQRRYAQPRITAYRYPVGSPGSKTFIYNNEYGFSGDTIENLWIAYLASTGFYSESAGLPNAVKLKALVKIADAKVNVAVAYAEAAKTSSLILDTARRIEKAYRAFRRGNLVEVAKTLNISPKTVHKSWLEYKYGWMPLLMDVKGAAEFFAQQHVVRPPSFQVSAVEKFVKTYRRTTPYTMYGGVAQSTYVETITVSYEERVKIWCELSSPHLSELQQIGLTNPALIAWELVPFSFVFDWFISVGDWLTGLTALQGVTVKRAMTHSLVDYAYSYDQKSTTNVQSGIVYVDADYFFGGTFRQYIRNSYVPSGAALYPPVTNSFNFPKLVTSLALIRGGFRGNARV